MVNATLFTSVDDTEVFMRLLLLACELLNKANLLCVVDVMGTAVADAKKLVNGVAAEVI